METNTRICTKCGQELPATNEYFNKHKTGKYGLRQYCKKCENNLWKQYYKENKEKIKAKREANSEYYKEYQIQYYKINKEAIKKAKEKYYTKNKEYIKKAKEKYYKENKEKFKVFKHKRKAKIKKLPNTLTLEQWNEIKFKFHNKCAYCGQAKPLAQDHFIPLSKNGEYTKNNIVPACKHCNSKKNNSNFFEWYPKYEFYSEEREKIILEYLGYENNQQQLKLI